MASARKRMKTNRSFVAITQGTLLDILQDDFGMVEEHVPEKVPPHRQRNRRQVNDIFNEQGPTYVRRAYRMHADSFWALHKLLKNGIAKAAEEAKGTKKHRNGAKNGVISTSVRLSAAIRYFAGGRPDDIALVHGISHSEVFTSVWKVVDAVNDCAKLNFAYPTSHERQKEIAREFQAKSDADFPFCGGCLDGMMVWYEKPSAAMCKEAQCGTMKFMCGRKKKYGVNLQGICDAEGRFLDVSIGHPASTSDYLAFSTSKIFYKLEQEGFLAEGICIFGDLAYVNTNYMATPYKSVRSGTKDDYNFFHSQLRIRIECAFGMLVNRWGLLRRALSSQMSFNRSLLLVMTLCRLHNFCISERLRHKERSQMTGGFKIAQHLASDQAEIMLRGGVPLERRSDRYLPNYVCRLPEQLLHGGEHHDDTERNDRRRTERQARGRSANNLLPRDIMHAMVVTKQLQRPEPNKWRDKKADYYTV